ncbi:hypothetical protein NW755_010671 [Fusarium falciforme]|uniref:Ubiquitin-like domain-containing protein n=1 Tax=Fusarium falciforme TaxID=195108 RepID=A0A9W8R0Z5_9HYPO|nr:hypothetical protein NW755_010671 [Fusarium falciforme]
MHALEGLSSRADIANAKGRCPLCYDFQIESEKQYEKHVGQHLEHLALFTLPDTGGGGDDDEDGNEDKEEERLDDGDEDDDDDDEEDEEEDWLVTDDPGSKVADQQQKAEAEAFDKLNREAQESREIHQAAKKAAADGDEEALAEAVANFEEESKMVAAVVEARGAAEKAAQELKEKIQKETKAKSEESKKAEQAPIRFKDAGMEDLIKQSFPQVEVVGLHVVEGRYDLIGPDGEIILPSVWEKVVQPDWAITMRMWPGYEMPPSRTRWTHQPVQSPAPAPGKEDPEKIRLEAELTTFKAMEEEQKAAEKQKEVEAQIRKEAEEAFRRRMEAMRIAQEEAKEEIEKVKIDAIRAARERMEAERKAED